jgi:protein-tyrosine phosphatase
MLSDNISNFYNNSYFGGYPTQEEVYELENKYNISTFVDLTSGYENMTVPYTTENSYINYYIIDKGIPKNIIKFTSIIHKIVDLIKKNNNIYIHCKGGHGRSGIVVACLLVILKSLSPENAIKETTNIHNERKNMKDIWKKMGSPQTLSQKKFVNNYFKPYYINKNNCLHISHLQIFKIPNFDYFISVQHAMHYFLHIIKNEEIKKILNIHISNDNDITQMTYNTIFNIIYYKIKNNIYILSKLMHTGMRPIIMNNKMVEESLDELRKYFYINNYDKIFTIC